MFKGADAQAGKTGKSMGKALKSNFESANQIDLDDLRKEVETGEAKITSVIERSSQAQAKSRRAVEIAEAELNEKRASGRASASQLMKAEDKLALARQKSEAATAAAKSDLEKYTKALDESKSALADAEAAAGRAAEGSVSAWAGVGQRIKAGLSGDFKTAFSGVEGDAAASANDVAGEFTQAGGEASGGFSSKLMDGLKGIGGLVGVAGIGASLAAGVVGGMEREKLGDKVAAQLNLAGPEAEKAGTVAGNLYAGAWGESLDETHDAVATVMSSIPGMMDAPAASLEGVTAKALDMATAFDVDVNESVGAIGVMMREGLAPDANAAFDLMVGGMQRVPAAFREELLPAFTEYSGYFGDLGISGETAMNMMIRGAENGTIGIDKMGDAVKEFQIRSTDMSKATGEVYDTLGLDMQDMTNMLLAGGDSAQDALGQIINGLTEIEDPAARAEAAIGLFGTPLEDLSVNEIPNFLGMLDPAGDALDNFAGSSDKLGDTLNNNTATAFESLKRGISTAFVDAVGGAAIKMTELYNAVKPVGEWLSKYADVWGPFAVGIGLVAGAFGAWTLAASGASIATGALATVMGVLTAPITGIVVGIGLLVGSLIYAYKNIGWFRDAVDFAWDRIQVATSWLIDTFKNLGSNTAREFGVIKGAALAVGAWFSGTLVPWFRSALAAIGGFFTALNTNVIQPVWQWIKGAISNVVTWFTGTIVPNFHKSINALGQFFDFLYRNFIAPFVWAFRMAVGAVSAWFRDNILPVFKRAIAAIGAAFRWLNDSVIQPVWSWIQYKIGAVANWFNTKRLELQARIAALGEAFKRLYNAYVKPVWDWIKSKIQAVGNWFRDVLVPAFRGAIQRVADKFSEFKTRVNTVWEGVKTLLRNGWNWISGNVFDPIKSGLNTLKDSFTRTKDGIGKTWDKLKAKVKEPIAFVVNKVINPFIGGYNKLNNFWSGTDLNEITGFHAGGYTGPGSKYQPAGVVHADEYVIRKESQNDLSRNAPGLLDNLNKYGSKALGYATGGHVGGPQYAGPGTSVFGLRSFSNPLQSMIRQYGEMVVNPIGGISPTWQVRQSAAAWNGVSGIGVRIGKPGSGPTVHLHESANPPFLPSGVPNWAGVYYGNNQIALNPNSNVARNPGMAKAVTVHEMGHALGLPHAHQGNGAHSIMNYNTMYRAGGVPTIADVRALQAIYPGGSGKAQSPGSSSGDDGNVWLDQIKNLVTKPIDAAKDMFKSNKFVQMPLGIADKMVEGVIDKAASLIGLGGGDSGPAGSGQVTKWMTTALKKKGLFSEANLASGVRRAMQESGGDPRAVNNWDVNALRGDPSKGLMQTIGATFRQYMEPGHSDIFNAIDNILASINYTMARYGSLRAGWDRPGGYADGGLVKPGNVWDDPVGTVHRLPQGVSSIYNGTGGAEYFQRVNPDQPTGGLNIHGDVYTVDETQFANKVFRKMDQRRSLAYVA